MKTYEQFKNDLGKQESSNNYKAVNKYGYLGRWQFGKPRLFDLGLSVDGWRPKLQEKRTVITKEQFLNDEELQNRVFDMHVKDLVKRIKKQYPNKLNRIHGGVAVTLSGLVAGAHLLGMGGVRDFFNGIDGVDGNGTRFTRYLTKFANYDIG